VLRSVVLIAQAQIQRQSRKNFPGILRVKVQTGSADPIYRVGKLKIVVREAAHEIGQNVAGKWGSEIAEIVAAVGEEVEIEVVAHSREISAKLHVVLAPRPAHVVVPVAGNLMQPGRSRRRCAPIEV